MVLANGDINIIADMEGTTGVKLHNNRQKLRSRFDIVRKLGQGTYGKVQLAINKDTGEEVAIKTIKKSKIETEQDLVRIQREIQIMSSVQHAHIIHIYEVFENREKIVLVMEYANGGELYDYLSFKKVLTEAEARRVFRQVVAAVFYCHKNMICHRDLKLENILLDERGNAKIADFGLSNIFDERSFLNTFCGSPLYASPEIVKGTPYFGPEVDCWSLGVLLYTLVYGAMPFDGSNFKRLVKQISEGDYYEPKVPSEASGLIRHMLTVEPSKRATVDDICCHIWVNAGEELPLLEVSQEMCQQMPVRLDYLLALSAAAAASAAGAAPATPATTDDAKPQTPEAPPIAKDVNEVADEEDDSQWERPALQALASETKLDDQVSTTTTKKHKMASSTSTPQLPSSSSNQVVHKKRKEDEEKKGDGSDAPDGNDKGGGAERIAEQKPLQPETGDIEMVSVDDCKTDKITDSNVKTENESNDKVTVENTSNIEPTANTDQDTKEDTKTTSVTSDKTTTGPKRKPSVTKKSQSTTSTIATTKPSGPETNGTTDGATTKPVNKVSKFRKSVSIGKDGSGSTSPSTPPTDAISAAAAGTPPLSTGLDKRKTSFGGTSSSRIADARKAFERRSPEKKPVFLPGSKVNSVRRSFESPPATPEAGSPSVKGIAKPFGVGAERKGSLTTAAAAKKTNESAAVATTQEPAPSIPDVSTEKKNGANSPLVKQPSRTNARTTSPTKGFRASDKQVDPVPGLHHRGCVPTEAKAAAQESKKPSPPKSLVRKNSLSKTPTNGGFSKSPSKEMKAVATTPLVAVAGRVAAPTVRPRSPTKTLRSASLVSASKAATTKASAEQPKATTDGAQDAIAETTVAAMETSLEQSTVPMLEVDIPDNARLEKRGSIEIAPVPSSALVRRYPENDQDDDDQVALLGPQLRFIPRDKGTFTLLGVKSEVVFDVPNDDQQLAIEDGSTKQVASPQPHGAQESGKMEAVQRKQPVVQEPTDPSESDSKIIRYIATVRKHGSTSERGTAEESGPERVTLLKLRCSTSQANDDGFSEPKLMAESPPVCNESNAKSVSTKSPSIKISMKLGADQQAEVQVDTTGGSTEQRGYNVYRSKYHSVQKYRSIIERRDGEEAAEHEEVQEVKGSTAAASSSTKPTASVAASVERSDSFSSTGSNDDLEDVFESLTSETLFTSLLSRTRNLMDRLSDSGENSSHSRWLRSIGRPSMLSSAAVSGARGFTSPLSSFAISSPSLSFRMNMAPTARSTYASEHSQPTSYRNTNGSPGIRDYRMSEDIGSPASDDRRRFRYSRSTTRSGAEDDEDATTNSLATRIRSTNASVSSSRVSFSNFNSSSSQLSESREQQQRQSRYDTAHRTTSGESDVSAGRDCARSDIISALMRHRNRSLDDRGRPRSYYDAAGTTSPSISRDWTPTSSFSSMRSPTSAYAQQQQQASVRNRSFPEEPASLYGTTARRPGRFQRYSKSVTKELAEEYDTDESTSLPRPRSLLVLSDQSTDEAGSSAAVSPSEESVAAATSVTRDYSKSVSQEGSMRCEEERELEEKHRVTQLQNGVVTSSVRRETKRSVSQTEDSEGGGSSTASSTPTLTGLQQRLLLKKVSGDDLTRQDSGIGSLYESGAGSGPATPTSAGVSSSRRGILKFARSISSELEEEINRIGSGLAGIDELATPEGETPLPQGKRRTSSEGPASDNGQADGSATPVSDSAETGSVCSDTASTDTPYSQQQRGSEEESVGERIRRKSFFARFNDTRTPRKNRKSSASGNLPSAAALRSELGRSSSLRHHIFESDSPLGGGGSHRSYFDPTGDFFSPPPLMRRCSGGTGSTSGASPHHQRWSMHFGGSNNGGAGDGSPFDPNDYLYGGTADLGVPPLPRRGSQTSSYATRSNVSTEGQWSGEDHDPSTSNLNRTHSLPEDDMPPRPVFRQHSVPGTNGNFTSGDPDAAGDAPSTARRRPDRLNLYPQTSRGAGQMAVSPSEEVADQSEAGSSFTRRSDSTAGSPPGSGRRSLSGRHGRLGPLDAWDGVGSLHGRTGHSLASLMDSLESPSEVLQKAMDLCDSLRFS